jgi:adenylylsulfate kinase-like enzyme
VDDPYEAPENPEIVVKTGDQTAQESADQIIAYLEENDWLVPAG